MSSDIDRTGHQEPVRTTYSYASVADTFFWGEKRQFLPLFQNRDHLRHTASETPAGPRLQIVTSSGSVVRRD
jgi:hypothetical protein